MFVAAHLAAHVWGGAERAVTLLLRGLQSRGARVHLYCNDRKVADRAGALGVPTSIAALGGDVAVHDAIRFSYVLRRDKPDALIVGTFKKMWLAALAARLAGVPHTVARIGLQTDTPRNVKYRAVMSRWVDTIVLTADATRDTYRRLLPSFVAERLVTIPTGVIPPLVTHTRDGVRDELGVPRHARVIGAVARLAKQKRFDRLLEAMVELPPDVYCVVAGEGNALGPLENLARTLGIDTRVHFAGRREDVGNILTALDLFVISSDKEGLSNAMLEALSLGVPVVSTDVSGAREALEPMRDGTAPGEIVPFEPKALAAAIRRILDDPSLRARMSQAAARRARERFDFDRMLDEWERVLRMT
ncbi:MAG TPA: glycosyltransferase [Gemmatimonadaceae bacterium]|nr:glycosyltransferase [Gemmatimonadaceae bacterium]